jgi:hypothetical protein
MLALASRKSLGFEDDFEGYVFLKENDPKRPILQFHLYKYDSGRNYFHTLFWRGQTTLEQISQALIDTVENICERHRVSRSAMSVGSVYFAQENIFNSAQFDLVLSDDEDCAPDSICVDSDSYYSDTKTISFVRFDIRNDEDLPITLWADLQGGNASEVGCSFSNMDLPAAVLSLFQSTCREEITAKELEEIQQDIWDHSKVPATV